MLGGNKKLPFSRAVSPLPVTIFSYIQHFSSRFSYTVSRSCLCFLVDTHRAPGFPRERVLHAYEVEWRVNNLELPVDGTLEGLSFEPTTLLRCTTLSFSGHLTPVNDTRLSEKLRVSGRLRHWLPSKPTEPNVNRSGSVFAYTKILFRWRIESSSFLITTHDNAIKALRKASMFSTLPRRTLISNFVACNIRNTYCSASNPFFSMFLQFTFFTPFWSLTRRDILDFIPLVLHITKNNNVARVFSVSVDIREIFPEEW